MKLTTIKPEGNIHPTLEKIIRVLVYDLHGVTWLSLGSIESTSTTSFLSENLDINIITEPGNVKIWQCPVPSAALPLIIQEDR